MPEVPRQSIQTPYGGSPTSSITIERHQRIISRAMMLDDPNLRRRDRRTANRNAHPPTTGHPAHGIRRLDRQTIQVEQCPSRR